MDISIYFSPIPREEQNYLGDQIGGTISAFKEGGDFPNWEDADLILIGVNEDRGSVENKGCAEGPNEIRKQLNQLYFAGLPTVVDLGNILPGEELSDTYFALQSSIDTLIKEDKTVIVMGGSQDSVSYTHLTLPTIYSV